MNRLKHYLKEIAIFIVVMTIFANILSIYKSSDLNNEALTLNSITLMNNELYSFKEDKLSLSRPMMMTRMFCQGSVEGEFTKALAQMKTYKIKGQSLEIFDANGLKLAEFKSVYLH